MKILRYALYAALVIVAITLWKAWQTENIKSVANQQQVTQTQETNNQVTNNSYSFHENINHQVNKISSKGIYKTPSDRIIHIKTDVLDVSIDKLGGNIISADLLKYDKTLKDNSPVKLLDQNPDKYYIAQSGLVLPNQNIDHKPLQFTSSQNKYQLNNSDKSLVVKLIAHNPEGLAITKTYTFQPGKYAIKVAYDIKNVSNKPWVGSEFMQFTRSTTPPTSKGIMGFRSFFGVAVSSPDHPYQKYSFKKLSEKSVKQVVQGGWIAMVQHYFIGAWVPTSNVKYRYYSKVTASGLATIGVIGPKLEIAPGKTEEISSMFYSGPKIEKRLKELSPKLWLTIDFGWLYFFSLLIFKLLKWINEIIGNWGWSIITLTILIKLAFYHLSATSYKSMAAMRKLQPKVARLKEQYVDDKQGMSKAMMGLYKKEKINPLGGCLPILIQIPVFIALYYVLLESVELRQAPFIFWIHDLAAKDPSYILPILMGISMFLQQKLSPAPPDATQAKMMMFLPVIMTVFFLNFPAGLVLYWLVNNVVSVLQQWYITKRYESGAYDKKKKWKN